MKTHFILAFFLVSLMSVCAQKLEQVTDNSSVNFKIKNMGFTVKGTFNEVNISSSFNSSDLENSFINGVILINSIDTKNKKRDKHLRNKDFFETQTYKEIQFKSSKIEKSSNGNYQLKGKLIIKSITKEIDIPINVTETATSTTMNINFSINRLDFGVGKSSWYMSDTVKIKLVYTANK